MPGVVAGLVTLLAAGRSRRFAFPALGLALGFLAGHAGLFGLPPVPSASRVLPATDWMAWLAVLSGVVLLPDGALGRWPVLARLARLALLAGTLALVLRTPIEHSWDGLEATLWCGGLALLAAVLWTSVTRLAPREHGASLPLVLLAVATGLAVCVGLTGSARIAQSVGLACAGIGAVAVARAMRPAVRLAPGDTAWVALVLVGFGTCAHLYSELPAGDAALVAGGLVTPWLADLPALRGLAGSGDARRTAVRVVLALVPVGIAVTRSALAFELDPGPYDYEY